jgi:hypothetical protein
MATSFYLRLTTSSRVGLLGPLASLAVLLLVLVRMLNLRLAALGEVVKLDCRVLPADSGLLQARPDALNHSEHRHRCLGVDVGVGRRVDEKTD